MYEQILGHIALAYPEKALLEHRVEFVMENGVPRGSIDSAGLLYVTLRSLEWGTEERVLLGRPMTELERTAAPYKDASMGWSTGGEIADRMSAAVRALQEPPPFYVET